MIVRGIEHLAYDLCHGVLLHGAQVIALIEGVHVYLGALCAPETQDADALAVLAGDHHIVGNGVNLLRVLYIDAVIAVLPAVNDIASKLTSTLFSSRATSHTSPPGSQKSGISVCQPSTSFCLKIPYS